MIRKVLFALPLGLLILIHGLSYGATLNVPLEYSTIQSAIDDAKTGDEVLVDDGIYSDINFGGKAITVRSVNGAASTTIDGNADGSVVTFENSETPSSALTGFTITNGQATNGGGIFCDKSSSPTITSCIISGNSATSLGGGIYCQDNSHPTITNCIISNNTSSSEGGGIYCSVSDPIITNCTITGNSASLGGGIYYAKNSSPSGVNIILWGDTTPEIESDLTGSIDINYSDVQQSSGIYSGTGNINDDPQFKGGGDYHLTVKSLCIDVGTDDTEIYSNLPPDDIDGESRPKGEGYDMGAYEYPCPDKDSDGYFAEEGCGTEIDCDDNDRTVFPGAPERCNGIDNDCDGVIDNDGNCINCPIYVPDDYLTIQGAIDDAFEDCDVIVKDGVYLENINFQGKPIVVRSENGPANTIINGNAGNSVVIFENSEVASSVLEGFTIINGKAVNGGGIRCDFSSPTIRNCIISSNSALDDGGGIHCRFSNPEIINCTISDNLATNEGGGIFCQESSPQLVNCTISGNEAADYNGGGIACFSYSNLTVVNSILWNNTAGEKGNEIYLSFYSFADISYSDVRQNSGIYPGTGNINDDPLFVGGDYHLSAGSPCIDRATATAAPADDVDGDPRPQGAGYDMGSDEYLECTDEDGDTYAIEGYSCGEVDCADDDKETYPGADELCDGKDNDCDDVVPPDEADADEDDYRICNGDCDDDDRNTYPGAPELCDGKDNDCDGVVPDNEADADEDNYRICEGDCDDDDPAINPGATEVCDGIDNNCDGQIDEEACLPTLTISTDKSSYTSGDNMKAILEVISGKPTVADLYIRLHFPNGAYKYYPTWSSFPKPAMRNWTVTNYDPDVFFSYTFKGSEAQGNYKWQAALTEPGTHNIIGHIILSVI